jgi:hypothetical protein
VHLQEYPLRSGATLFGTTFAFLGFAKTTVAKCHPKKGTASMKKAFVVSLLLGSMFLNQACTDEEVNATIIGIGVGVGVAAVVAAGPDDHRPPPDRHDGDWDHRGGRPDRFHGRCPGCSSAVKSAQQDLVVNMSDLSPADEFAEKYQIPTAASAKIKTAFAAASKNGLSSFESIGLAKSDLQAIAQKQLPEAASLKNVAQKLDMSEAQSRDLLKSMINEFSQQSSNVESTYWKSCMAKGKWKTPENASCSSTSWNGCAPETGASLCL